MIVWVWTLWGTWIILSDTSEYSCMSLVRISQATPSAPISHQFMSTYSLIGRARRLQPLSSLERVDSMLSVHSIVNSLHVRIKNLCTLLWCSQLYWGTAHCNIRVMSGVLIGVNTVLICQRASDRQQRIVQWKYGAQDNACASEV